ncbi:MAG: hypothetical protein ACLU4I_13445, partial [Subdoligranulum sp.]
SAAPRSPYRHLELCGIAICFDTFADKSVAAEKRVELDDKTFGNMIKKKSTVLVQKKRPGMWLNDVSVKQERKNF